MIKFLKSLFKKDSTRLEKEVALTNIQELEATLKELESIDYSLIVEPTLPEVSKEYEYATQMGIINSKVVRDYDYTLKKYSEDLKIFNYHSNSIKTLERLRVSDFQPYIGKIFLSSNALNILKNKFDFTIIPCNDFHGNIPNESLGEMYATQILPQDVCYTKASYRHIDGSDTMKLCGVDFVKDKGDSACLPPNTTSILDVGSMFILANNKYLYRGGHEMTNPKYMDISVAIMPVMPIWGYGSVVFMVVCCFNPKLY